jgi:hypothetical protein
VREARPDPIPFCLGRRYYREDLRAAIAMNMKFPDIDNFKMDDQYFEEIFPGVWLMDDHRWAYYVWEKVHFEK